MDRAPDDLLSSYATARNAIHDAPTGEQNVPSPHWTPETVRSGEQDYLDNGAEQRVVVAVHEGTNTVVGTTELELHSNAHSVRSSRRLRWCRPIAGEASAGA